MPRLAPFVCLLFAVLATTTTACSPSWDGRYLGPLTTTGSCSDGSGIDPSTADADWVLKESATGLSIEGNGSCGTFMADVDHALARFRPKTCPPFSIGDYLFQPTISSGTLALTDKSLSVSIKETIFVSGAGTGTCTTSATGTLTRQR